MKPYLAVRGKFVVVILFSLLYPAFGAGLKQLSGHVPKAVKHLNAIGRLPATHELRLAIGLQLHDSAGLDEFLAELYDPASPNYHQYLTSEQLTARFGPTETDYQAVMDFARRNHLKVTATSVNRLLLDVQGSVSNIEAAFRIKLLTYHHPTEPRDFYAPDAEPTVNADLPVADVSGLDNFQRPRPISKAGNVPHDLPLGGSGTDGYYLGSDFRRAYAPGVTLGGSGQIVGLYELEGYYASDITNYESQCGYTNVPLQNVIVDGVSGTPGYSGIPGAVREVSADIELVIAMAPALAKVIVFEGNTHNDVLNTMLTYSNQVNQMSCSWGWSGGPSTTTDNIFKLMDAAGQAFFQASGDADAYVAGSANDVDSAGQANSPSSNPYITQVGGTDLATTGPGGFYAMEAAWNVAYTNGGSGGGVSTFYPIPTWQTNVNNLAGRGGSTGFRNIPDVAAASEYEYCISDNGSAGGFGGTSGAAPLWAGFTALINQQAAANGRPRVGFINPALYSIAARPIYSVCFHDVVLGDNTWPGSPNLFYATNGYDLCTGLGTPGGGNLINALAGSIVVSPNNGFIATGAAGGPFNTTAQVYTLTNLGAASLKWGVVSTSSWLTVSASSGTLAAAQQTNFTVSLAAAANSLAAGIYPASVVVTNQAGAGVLLPFNLQVGQPLVLNGGFETGDLTGWAFGGILNAAYTEVIANANFVHSGNYGALLGQAGSMAYLSQSVATTPGQNYVLSFWLDNPILGGTFERFQVNWNDTRLMTLSNPPVMTWTNYLFPVTATGTSSLLLFGEEDNVDYFGLDDVSVTPLPLTLKSAVKTGNSLNLTWIVATGLVYQVQYQTNLLQTNWVNLGNAITATITNLAVTDTNALINSSQRFYRLQVSP